MKRIPAGVVYWLITSLAFFVSCENDDDDNMEPCIEATGPIVTESRTVGSFHSISLRGVANILLTQGTTQSLRIETHQNILDLLETAVAGEVLQIDLDACTQGQIDRLDIFITIPDIRLLKIEGVGDIAGQNDFDLDALNIEIFGVGVISLSGMVNTLDIMSAGVGNVDTFDMTADNCEVSISGSGNVEVTVSSALDVTISGSGNVLYKGNPTISANISGSGTVVDAN